MRYIITRTSSSLWDDQKPHDRAENIQLRRYLFCRKDDKYHIKGFMERCIDIEELPDGCMLRGISKEIEHKWVIEIDDIHEFVDSCEHEVILRGKQNYPDYGEMYYIEIYDDYRE